MAVHVFQVHSEDFLNKIDLGTLTPILYSKGLLTPREHEAVTYHYHLPTDRRENLIRYLESKGNDAVPKVLECLRQETSHPPHAELADIIENFLSQQSIPLPVTTSSPVLSTDFNQPVSESTHHLKSSATSDIVVPIIGSKRIGTSSSVERDNAATPPLKREKLEIPHEPIGTRKRLQGKAIVAESESTQVKRPRYMYTPTCKHPTSEDFHKFQHVSSQEFGQQYIPSKESDCRVSKPSLPESLQILAKSVKATYRDKNFFNKAAGPSPTVGSKIQFIKLALVKKQSVSEADIERDAFLKSTLHGAVDDIIKKKNEITRADIFNYSSEGRKLVLVEGAPGVGKTMLAMKLCVDWANDEYLQEYDLVLLVQLRRFQGSSEMTVEELVGIYLGKNDIAKQASCDLLKHHSNVLLILEGWDELPPNLRKEMTFFFDIVQAYKLAEASVMVTSRPSVTASLYDYFDERHIEVLGFTRTEIENYVKHHTSSALVANMVLDHFKQFPNLRALAHIPLTLAIICSLVKDGSTLPPTLTELYKRHICNTLHQNIESLSSIKSIDELDESHKTVIEALSSLALNGFKEKRFVFSHDDLLQVGLNEQAGFDGYGLLSTIQVPTIAGYDCFYQFRHLSIQEYLAAYCIKELTSEKRLQLLKEFRNDRQFQNVWKFLAGITQLKQESVQELIISETNQANRAQLFLLHCLFEAHDSHICEIAAAKVKHTINLSNITLNTTDCLCVAYVITKAGGEWLVNLRGANIGEDGLEVFKSHLLHHVQEPEFQRTEVNIKQLDLAHNRITGNAIHHLAQIVESELHLEQIDLATNKIGNIGMDRLTSALTTNHTVTHLHFSGCDLKVDAARSIGDMLKGNNTLKDIYLGFEDLRDEGVQYIADALKENCALKELALTRTRMTIIGLQAIAEMMAVNKTLEVIRLDRNDFGPNECRVVAKIIANSVSIALIDLSKNHIGDEGFEVVLDSLIEKPKGSLKKLGVYGCKITHKSLSKLVDLFAATETFAGIQLGFNDIGDEGAELIGKALEKNKSQSVKTLLLESSGITNKGKKKLKEIQESLGRDPNDLDVNFTLNSQVKKRREEMNS